MIKINSNTKLYSSIFPSKDEIHIIIEKLNMIENEDTRLDLIMIIKTWFKTYAIEKKYLNFFTTNFDHCNLYKLYYCFVNSPKYFKIEEIFNNSNIRFDFYGMELYFDDKMFICKRENEYYWIEYLL